MKKTAFTAFAVAAVTAVALANSAPAEAAYTCRPNLATAYCQWATQCEADGHSVWERQFSSWMCVDNKGAMKRKDCKQAAEAAKASGVIDFHFAAGTCYFVFSKK